jgi:acyl-CoA thioester hydrolase
MEQRMAVYAEAKFKVEFNDLDPMNVVWNGNYLNYYEKARRMLLDEIGYNYNIMKEDGFVFPVASIKSKYMHSLTFGDTVRVKAVLKEYELCLKIEYEVYNDGTGVLCNKGESVQMAVEAESGESCFGCPQALIEGVKRLEQRMNNSAAGCAK